jgi:hypothetical protein
MSKVSTQPLPAIQEEVPTGTRFEEARDGVRQNLNRLEEAFQHTGEREALQGAADNLRTSLDHLEDEAGRKNEYEQLSRVAAVLHDVLKHNPVVEFTEEQQRTFVRAAKYAIQGAPEQADALECDRVLYGAGLDWLPPIEWPDEEEEDAEEE